MTVEQTVPEPESNPETRSSGSRSSEARFRAVVKALSSTVWTADAGGAFTTEPPPWGSSTGDAIRPEDQARAMAAWRRAVESRTVWRFEYPVRRYDDDYRWFAVVAVPVMNAAGAVSEWIGMETDITDRKRAERDHEQLLREAQEARAEADIAKRAAEAASRARSEFLATMSHEFRTPLNGIVGYTQLLELELAGPLTPQQREYLTRLGGSAKHLLALVSDVLDVAKVDAGQLSIVQEEAMTGDAVAAALGMMRPQAKAKSVALIDLGEGTTGVPYVGDEDRVRQILTNLISNAVKFTAAGGTVTTHCELVDEAPPEVRVQARGPWASVTVTDTGVGIAAGQLSAIFEAFHQIDGGHTRAADGTGLGLTISRRLARLMGGDLTVKSELGRGSAFTLWLPATMRSVAGEAEEIQDRGDRHAALSVRGLGDVGEALRAEIDHILDAYNQRLRADPSVPEARVLRQPELEDHALSLLADFAQSLVIISEASEEAPSLLRDGSAIQRTVAERHGIRRYAQRWTEQSVRREYAIMREEIERAVRVRLRTGDRDATEALGVLLRLLDKSAETSLAAWQQAALRHEH